MEGVHHESGDAHTPAGMPARRRDGALI
jgi:hypothetical protein